MVQFGVRGGHGGALSQHVLLAVAGGEHIQLVLGRTQLGRRLPLRRAGVVQFLLGNGIGGAHGRDALQIDARVLRHRGGGHYRGAGLSDLLHAVAAFQAGQIGLLSGQFGSGLVPLLAQQIVVQPGQRLALAHRIAFIHQHRGDTAAHAKAQIHLPDIHIAVQGQIAALPSSEQVPGQEPGPGQNDQNGNNLYFTGNMHAFYPG